MTFKNIVFFATFLFYSLLAAKVEGNMIGGEPVETWKYGGQDFFVMFNSNIDKKFVFFGEDPENPQGDTCVDKSSFTLTDFHIPEDAIIEKAYLIWMGAVDPEKLDQPTDNSVKFKFIQSGDDPVGHEQIVSAGSKGKLLTDAGSFEFEPILFADDVEQGCTETEGGVVIRDIPLGYFTYRVDITDFFDNIEKKNSDAEKTDSGLYYGDYEFSGLDCTEHDNYRCKTTMVSSWAVFFVYRSTKIMTKKIYLYSGFSFVQGDQSTFNVSGFTLPALPVVRLTAMVAEGDPKLIEPAFPAEGIFLQGEGAVSKFRLFNECNPIMGTYIEIFNSVSSVLNWNSDATEKIKCVSGPDDEKTNYGIDVDTFILDPNSNENLKEHLKKGNTSFDIILSVNQDAIFTNFIVLSVDSGASRFDIPPEASDTAKSKYNFPLDREKHFCACPSTDNGKELAYFCEDDRPFFYFIKVQNWDDSVAENVVVTDELDRYIEYIPGTTAMATVYSPELDAFTDWTVIPDKPDGVFPLSGDGFKVSSKMRPCNRDDWTCEDTVLIRYKVKPKAVVTINYVLNNTAFIKGESDIKGYETNQSYPLKLRQTRCVPKTECPEPTEEMCGGTFLPEMPDEIPDDDSDNMENNEADIDEADTESISDVETNPDNDIIEKNKNSGCGCSLI
jgi:hypothetical protein